MQYNTIQYNTIQIQIQIHVSFLLGGLGFAVLNCFMSSCRRDMPSSGGSSICSPSTVFAQTSCAVFWRNGTRQRTSKLLTGALLLFRGFPELLDVMRAMGSRGHRQGANHAQWLSKSRDDGGFAWHSAENSLGQWVPKTLH